MTTERSENLSPVEIFYRRAVYEKCLKLRNLLEGRELSESSALTYSELLTQLQHELSVEHLRVNTGAQKPHLPNNP